MATESAWDELVRSEWRRRKAEPSSVEALDALEAELSVTLPAGVRWLDQQPFVVYRLIKHLVVHRVDGKDLAQEEAVGAAESTSARVATQLGQPHWWTRFEGFEVVEPWLPKWVVIAIDDYFGTYMLDFHFDGECPPVLYCNWSEGDFPDADRYDELGYMDLVADSFEDFLALPVGDYETGEPEFLPPRPPRRDAWVAWMEPRMAARYAELGMKS